MSALVQLSVWVSAAHRQNALKYPPDSAKFYKNSPIKGFRSGYNFLMNNGDSLGDEARYLFSQFEELNFTVI